MKNELQEIWDAQQSGGQASPSLDCSPSSLTPRSDAAWERYISSGLEEHLMEELRAMEIENARMELMLRAVHAATDLDMARRRAMKGLSSISENAEVSHDAKRRCDH